MKYILLSFMLVNLLYSCSQQQPDTSNVQKEAVIKSKYNTLTLQEQKVILQKATDRPFTGDYYKKTDKGVYICKQCNNPLYSSEDKFESHCGWPSFDDEIKGAVTRVPDADGMRTEIICSNCKGHLGHVFTGEEFTDKNVRHCVNTSSIQFYPSTSLENLPKVIK